MVSEIQSTPAISAVSKLRAANGNPVLSAESLQAIKNGEPAPQVSEPSQQSQTATTDNNVDVPSTSEARKSNSTVREEAVVVDLSPEAQKAVNLSSSSLNQLDDGTDNPNITSQNEEQDNVNEVDNNPSEASVSQGLELLNGLQQQPEQVDIIT